MEFSLRQLRYYACLYEKRSYTAAADALGITQPALSIAISKLEKALQVPLIERGTAPISITEFGEVFQIYSRRVLRDIEQARAEIAAIESGGLGRLDICLGPSTAGTKVGKVLSQMAIEFPILELHVSNGAMPDIGDGLLAGEYALYVGTTDSGILDPTLEVIPLTTISVVAVVGAGHALASCDLVGLSDLAVYPWISLGDMDSNLPTWSAAFLAEGITPPRLAIDIRHLALVRDLLMQGDFVTILPETMIAADLAGGLLAKVQPPNVEWTLGVNAVLRSNITLPSAAQLFLNRLREAYTDDIH
jgi:LysR family transcriptional regulator of gallate degradation